MKLIINADDFGLSESINDGIISGIKKGCITSTSIMANMDFAKDAVKKVLRNNISCVGLHINLTMGKPIVVNSNMTDENGTFLSKKEQLSNCKLTYLDVYNEIMAQMKKVDEYSDGKLRIDHLDCHHMLLVNDTIKRVVEDIALELNIPVRNENNVKAKCPDVFYMDFTIVDVKLEAIGKMIELYKDKDVIVEFPTHAGFIDEYTKTITSYLDREEELRVLIEAKNNGLFDEIELISYSQF